MRGRAGEIVETVSRRRVSVCAIQESRWKGQSARMISGKNCKYKFLWCGDETGFGGVGLLVEEDLVENVISVERINSRIMYIRIMIEKSIIRIFSVYVPQTGLPELQKEKFYNNLLTQTALTPEEEFLLICGDLNGHVGKETAGFDNVHGGNGFGDRNADGIRLLDFCLAANLAITNTFFSKSDNKLVTYQSGATKSQIDFILIPRNHLKTVRNITVINGEECTPQHKLIVGDIILNAGKVTLKAFPRRRRVWKLKEPAICEDFCASVNAKLQNVVASNDIDESWKNLKNSILESFDTSCGWSKPHQRRRETWWWNERVDTAVKEKRRLWKI
ncbi:craniofacial development protein 2-like [Clytia hemisphaerica]|uniref:craniofacial development protein 2-like n=1 Tax=Clytia hemisphaerica TaxID=252671 RepID=UPI0034D5D0D8